MDVISYEQIQVGSVALLSIILIGFVVNINTNVLKRPSLDLLNIDKYKVRSRIDPNSRSIDDSSHRFSSDEFHSPSSSFDEFHSPSNSFGGKKTKKKRNLKKFI